MPTPLTEEDVNGATAKFTLSMVEDADIYAYTLEVKGEQAKVVSRITRSEGLLQKPGRRW